MFLTRFGHLLKVKLNSWIQREMPIHCSGNTSTPWIGHLVKNFTTTSSLSFCNHDLSICWIKLIPEALVLTFKIALKDCNIKY